MFGKLKHILCCGGNIDAFQSGHKTILLYIFRTGILHFVFDQLKQAIGILIMKLINIPVVIQTIPTCKCGCILNTFQNKPKVELLVIHFFQFAMFLLDTNGLFQRGV